MPTDSENFYNSLSCVGKKIIGTLIHSAPHIEKPFPFIISSLQHSASCSKISVLRNLAKAEKCGLFNRKVNDSGHRYGSIITLNAKTCVPFEKLFGEEFSQISDTEDERYYQQTSSKNDWYRYTQSLKQASSPADKRLSLNPDNKTDRIFQCLSDQGKRILSLIYEKLDSIEGPETGLIIHTLALRAACSEVTARRVLSKVHHAGILNKKMHERGSRFGIIISENKPYSDRLRELLQAYPALPATEAARYDTAVAGPELIHKYNDNDMDTAHATHTERYNATDAAYTTQNTTIPLFAGHTPDLRRNNYSEDDRYQQPLILDREIKNLSLSKNGEEETEEQRWARRLLGISVDDFEVLWPQLRRENFGPDQIRQIVSHRMSFGETIMDIENSLHAAHYELENKTFPKARKGVCNYLFATLKNKGTWRRPQGFMTPNEQALANAEKEKDVVRKIKNMEQKKHDQAKQDAVNEEFETWLKGRNPEELQKIDAGCVLPLSTDESRRSWRKTWWRRNMK